MSLSNGTRLGPYEILAPLGAGGMGEVYKARDTRLDRTVAVKILPGQTADRREVRQRFEREARAVSALNHPHICTLHDVGNHAGIDYFVMEYVEGESLAQRLQRGPMPLQQAIRTATEVADALDRAHLTGIVHRDLKPGNIMLARNGAKVLDFGLAKIQTEAAGPSGVGSLVPTLTSPVTGGGAILGTLQYMSPEQLEGKEADARSDIFAFGVVLYEMIAGKRAFQAPTQAGLIAQILELEPAPLPPTTPPALERLIRLCMAKDPGERRQTMRDVLLDLKWIASGSPEAQAQPERRPRSWLWISAAAALGAVLALAAGWWLRPRTAAPPMRLTLSPPAKSTFENGLALSPDGRRLAFVARPAGGQDLLWIRALDELSAHPVAGSENASFPFWSPDGRFVAFFAQGKLKKLDPASGLIQVICDADDPRGGSWGAEAILFSPNPNAPLYRVAPGGGAPAALTKLDQTRAEISQRWPVFLPDGRQFVYFSMSLKSKTHVLVAASLDGKEGGVLTPTSSAAAWWPSGYLLFGRDSTLMAQPFSTGSLRLSGEPFPIARDLAVTGLNAGPFGAAQFSVSRDGTLVYQPGGARASQLTWFDRSGNPLGKVGEAGTTGDPDLSPDGTRAVVEGSADLWMVDLIHGSSSRFTFEGVGDTLAVWSPDGRRVAFGSARNGRSDIYVKSVETSAEELLVKSDIDKVPDDWSHDGRYLIYESPSPQTRYDLYWIPMDGDRKPVSYLQTEFNEFHARLSPDGHWLAYTSDETGRPEVYVQSFPTPGGKVLISVNGGDQPAWRRDGLELFYLRPDRMLMSVDVKTGAKFESGAPRPLFLTDTPNAGAYFRNHYAPHPDGQRFLVVNVPPEQSAAPLVVVLNAAPPGR